MSAPVDSGMSVDPLLVDLSDAMVGHGWFDGERYSRGAIEENVASMARDARAEIIRLRAALDASDAALAREQEASATLTAALAAVSVALASCSRARAGGEQEASATLTAALAAVAADFRERETDRADAERWRAVRTPNGNEDAQRELAQFAKLMAKLAASEAERATLAETVERLSVGEMTFAAFARENRARCEAPQGFNHALGSWSLSDWITATLGELGEAANVAKKLNRVRDGIPGNKRTPDQLRADLADEIADAFIYLDLLAQSQGFALADAVRAKFDAKSAEIGYTPTPAVAAAREAEGVQP